ncbi:MAG: LysR family transcriptional regulator [Nannocystaceae bacterium]
MSQSQDDDEVSRAAAPLDLETVAILCAVGRERSVSSAARSCGLPRSTAWRKLRQLEAALGCKLVERSARHLRLTAAGSALAARGRDLLRDAGEAVAEARSADEALGGVIKVGMPPGPSADLILAALEPLVLADGGPSFHVFESAGPLHPLKDDFDLIVTLSQPEDGDLYMRLLDTIEISCRASPEYLAERGPIRAPEELHDHHLLGYYIPPRSPTRWALRGGGSLQVRPLLAITNAETVARGARKGVGVGYAPWEFADSSGDLVPVLPDIIGERLGVYLVAGQRSRDSARVRLVQQAFERLRQSELFGAMLGR